MHRFPPCCGLNLRQKSLYGWPAKHFSANVFSALVWLYYTGCCRTVFYASGSSESACRHHLLLNLQENGSFYIWMSSTAELPVLRVRQSQLEAAVLFHGSAYNRRTERVRSVYMKVPESEGKPPVFPA